MDEIFSENLLTIGQFAQIAKVRVKQLRYYEQVGIFKPAYINPDTGYRYYLPSQFYFLDSVTLCIQLGIPLNEAMSYINSDGSLRVYELFQRCSGIITEKIDYWTQCLKKMRYCCDLMDAQKEFTDKKGEYTRNIDLRTIFCVQREKITPGPLATQWEALNRVALSRNISVEYPRGLITEYQNGEKIREYLFWETFDRYVGLPDIRQIRAGEFCCVQFCVGEDRPPLHLFLGRNAAHHVVVTTDFMSKVTHHRKPIFELQALSDGAGRFWVTSDD